MQARFMQCEDCRKARHHRFSRKYDLCLFLFQFTTILCFTTFLLTTAYLDVLLYGAHKSRVVSAIKCPPLKRISTSVQLVTFIYVVYTYIYGQIKQIVSLAIDSIFCSNQNTVFDSMKTVMSVVVVILMIIKVHLGATPVQAALRRKSSIFIGRLSIDRLKELHELRLQRTQEEEDEEEEERQARAFGQRARQRRR